MPDSEDALEERLCLLILALVEVELGQVVKSGGDIEVVGTQHFLSNGEGAVEKRFGLLVFALFAVERS